MSDFPAGAVMVFGATGGIGRVVAREFAAAGCDLALMYRSKDDVAAALSDEISAMGRQVTCHRCDVCDVDALQTAIADAVTKHDRIHTLIWGAGPVAEQVHIAESTRDQWRKAVNVEVHGFYDSATSLISHMRDQGGGSIVHLGSAGDLSFPPDDFLSVSPKAANESLIKGIAREEGKNGIRANSVLIGVIEAGMFLELSKQGVFDAAWTDAVQNNLAIKRWGQPEEIAHAAIFLASNKADYITGQQIAVAGGYGL